jgi:hypothetical protein
MACSGYLVDRDGFRLLIDPGYATLPRLLEVVGAVRAIYRGFGQLDRYLEELNRVAPGETPWSGQVVTYGG